MKAPTKNILTRDEIKSELRFRSKAAIRSYATQLLALSLFLLPFVAICIYGIISTSPPPPLAVLLFLLTVTLTVPLWIRLVLLLCALSEKRLLENGDFEVAVRELSYKEEIIVHRHTELILYFDDFSEIFVPSTTYDLASVGDTYYLVAYKGKKVIRLLYPAKMYALDGESNE